MSQDSVNKKLHINYLEFEQPIAELEAKIEELRLVGSDSQVNISEEIVRLQNKSNDLTKKIFKNLSAWQVVQLARHPLRPYSQNYLNLIFDEIDEVHGDRVYSDDQAIICAMARLNKQPVMFIGQQKGRDTAEKIKRNFGMPNPEGYRKALRFMQLAERYKMPVITFIDTPGAYPGVGAEARGQSEAIANNLKVMANLRVPVLSVVIGEGCSGGALGIGVADKVLMLQYAYYATISPEGCATILWKGADKAADAAEVMGITANRLLELGIIDSIINEPLGGAHRNLPEIAKNIKEQLIVNLDELLAMNTSAMLDNRYQKLMSVGSLS